MSTRLAASFLCLISWTAHASDPVVVEIGGVPTQCAASADGTWFVVGRHEGEHAVQRYDSATLEPQRVYDEEYGVRMSVNALAISPDDRLLAAGGFTCDAAIYAAQPNGTSFHARRSAAHVDNAVRVWDVESGVLLHSLPTEIYYITDLVFSPDATRLAAVTPGAHLQVWDVARGRSLLARGSHFDVESAECVTFVTNNRLAVADRRGTLRVIDVLSGVVVAETSAENVRGLTFHAPTQTMIAQHYFGVHQLTLEPFEVVDSMRLDGHVPLVHSVDLTPSGQYIALSHSEPGNDTTRPLASSGVAILDLERGATTFRSGPLPGGASDAAFIAGNRLVGVCRAGTLHAWSITGLEEPPSPAPPERSRFHITPTHHRFDPDAETARIASPFIDAPDAVREAMFGLVLTSAYHELPPAALPAERRLHFLGRFVDRMRTEDLSTVLSFTRQEEIDASIIAVALVLPERFAAALNEAIEHCSVGEGEKWTYYKPNDDAADAIDALGAVFRDDHADVTRAICAYAFTHQHELRAFRRVVRDVMPGLVD